MATWVRLLLLLSLSVLSGCAFDGGGGKSYEFDPGMVGTGQQSIVPLNDATHMDGQDLNTKRGR
jgi:hypothetical protein